MVEKTGKLCLDSDTAVQSLGVLCYNHIFNKPYSFLCLLVVALNVYLHAGKGLGSYAVPL